MIRAATIVFFAAAAGCYGTPRSSLPDADFSAAGRGGAGGQAGTSGSSGTGDAGGRGGTGGSGPMFVGGPCIVSPDRISGLEVFARASDARIYRRAFDGRNWGTWTALAGLDATMIDARSDLDCAASADTIHVVATGLSPPGSLLHAFGFATSYNPFVRELSPIVVGQSPSVALLGNYSYYLAWAGRFQQPGLYDLQTGESPAALTPITTLVDDLISAVEIAQQANSVFVAAFDSSDMLAVYPLSRSSGGNIWLDPIRVSAPSGTFALSPAICAESGLSGSFSINVAAVTGHDLWFAGSPRLPTGPAEFSPWTMISGDASTAPDCVVVRENPSLDAVIHVVVLSSRGTIVDLQGNGTSWVTTDLGPPR